MKGLYLLAFVLIVLPAVAQQGAPVSMTVNRNTGLMEIRNGLLGIVIPADKKIISGTRCLAPVQAFIYSNGAYSDNSTNFLNTQLVPTSASLKILTQTATVVSVQFSFEFAQKKFGYNKTNGKQAAPGRGYYYCTIQVRRGEKTIVIEEESNVDISYAVKISQGLSPDKARYRGWSAGAKELGYEPGGHFFFGHIYGAFIKKQESVLDDENL